ncbi:conjugal transfer protein TraB [Paraburkholderia sp. HD33-4]|uniref:conjugal transfer protein TraB n=1 Tax=Paraburkholderia sp. HD33-4 TaxID=2883242 RepID=UPI001F3BCC63|nr:conjugal transfer protein TraB [Paraburkholderia sp. HD33-4]
MTSSYRRLPQIAARLAPSCRSGDRCDHEAGTGGDNLPARGFCHTHIVCSAGLARAGRKSGRLWDSGQRLSLVHKGTKCGLYGAAGAAIALVAWYPGHWLIVLIVLPAVWSTAASRCCSLSLWGGYYLTGARDIPLVCERFFVGHGELFANAAIASGVAFWLGQAILLSAPWALLTPRTNAGRRTWRVVVATLLVSVPPLGMIGWLSPLHVASALFPGWQLAGLTLGVCALGTAAGVWRSKVAPIIGVLLTAAAMVAHSFSQRPEGPTGWVAVNTSFGRLDQRDYDALYKRTEAVRATADRQFELGARVVVLPEEVIGLWRPSTRYWWSRYLEPLARTDRTLVLGVDLGDRESLRGHSDNEDYSLTYTDSAVVLGAGHGRFDSRQPVPAGLWRPWANVSATPGHVMQGYLHLAGRRAAFSICYEDFLWWPHWRLLVDRPDVFVGMSNEWFSADLALANIQQQSAESIAKLAGVPLLRAMNR